MMNRQVALLIFLLHIFVLRSVNATSIQGVAVNSPSLSAGAPSVQSLLSGLPTGNVQSVTQPASSNVLENSQLQDIAELKRRADESDQKIVRLTAATQDLKDTSDQLKVSISQIANQQNAVAQTTSVTQTSTSSATSSGTQSVGTTQTVGMANIAGVLGVNPAATQATTQVITPNTTLPTNNATNVISAASPLNAVANTSGVTTQVVAGVPISTNGVGSAQGSVITASASTATKVAPPDSHNPPQRNSVYPSPGYYPPPSAYYPPPGYYPPPPGYYPPSAYYPPPGYYPPPPSYPPSGHYPPPAYPPQGGVVLQQTELAQNYSGSAVRHSEPQPVYPSQISNQSGAVAINANASAVTTSLPQTGSIPVPTPSSASSVVPTPVVDKITDLLSNKLFGSQTTASVGPSSNVPTSVNSPAPVVEAVQGGVSPGLPGVAAVNGVSAVGSPSVSSAASGVPGSVNGSGVGVASGGAPKAVTVGGGAPGSVTLPSALGSRVGNNPQVLGQSQEGSRPPVITLQESLRQRELLKQQGASTVPAAPNPAGQFFN